MKPTTSFDYSPDKRGDNFAVNRNMSTEPNIEYDHEYE